MIWALIAAAHAGPNEDFDAAIVRLLGAVDAAHDATFDLHQQEYVSGRLQPASLMHVKYRPFNQVYVEWDNGQRLLWSPGQNSEKMTVDPAGMLPAIDLAPDGWMATRGQRHTVKRMGLGPVGALFKADRDLILTDPRFTPTVSETTDQTVYGRPAQCFDAQMRKDIAPALYASRVLLCVDADTGLPLKMTCWDVEDGEMRMVEEYGYENLKVNVGLTDADFDRTALGL